MVDVTYQIVLSTLQTLALLVGIFYYVMTLRNQQRNQEISLKNQEISLKNQELTLQSQELSRKALEQAAETRQAQLFMDFYKLDTSLEFGKNVMELIWLWTWDDYDDLVKKYGPVSGSVDNYNKMISICLHFDGLGVQVKNCLMNIENVYDLYSNRLIPFWEKFAAVIIEARRRSNAPQIYEHFEWLYYELMKIREGRGHVFSVESVFKLEENHEKTNA
jgi:hypothetical protein